jgi:hypothetical protein
MQRSVGPEKPRHARHLGGVAGAAAALYARFSGASQGTGFFVAPGRILTCAHVVEDMHDKAAPIDIEWDGKPYPATILDYRAKPYPDLALLQVKPGDHPCVYLNGAIEVGDTLYSYGYTDEYPDGDSVTAKYEGPSGGASSLLKFKEGQVRPGLSGSPLLNQRTGAVCGIVKRTRARETDLGGRAIPCATILAELDELSGLQQRFHRADPGWRDCMSAEQRTRWRTVERPNPFYEDSKEPIGRDDEIRRIRAKLSAGNHCSIVGPPRSGKSLLVNAIQRDISSWLGCAPQAVLLIHFRDITGLKELQEHIVHHLGGSRANELRSLLRHKPLRLLILDDLGGMDPGERGLKIRRWLRGLDDSAGTKLLMVSNERLDFLFRKDNPNRDSPLAGLDPIPIELGPLSVETCHRIMVLRLEGTGLDPASFADLFQSPRQPRDLLDAAAARYEGLVNPRR